MSVQLVFVSYLLLNHSFFKRERGCPFFLDSPFGLYQASVIQETGSCLHGDDKVSSNGFFQAWFQTVSCAKINLASEDFFLPVLQSKQAKKTHRRSKKSVLSVQS